MEETYFFYIFFTLSYCVPILYKNSYIVFYVTCNVYHACVLVFALNIYYFFNLLTVLILKIIIVWFG